MWCSQCNNHLSKCSCEDLEERMKAIGNHPNIIFKKCSVCNKHYQLCKCETPIWTHSKKNQDN